MPAGLRVVISDSSKSLSSGTDTPAPLPSSAPTPPDIAETGGTTPIYLPFQQTEIVIGSESLDSPIITLEEPFQKLEENLPISTKGIARISLLVDESGIVLWSNLDFVEFDPQAGIKILNAFANTRFSRPYKNGNPVRVLMKVEVRVD